MRHLILETCGRFLNLEYRNDLIKKFKYILPISVIDFFLTDFNDLKTRSYGEAISPIIGFIDEMEMIPVFNSEQKSDNLINTIKNNFLVLFSLDRTKLGNKVTRVIAGLIMQQLLTIIARHEINGHIIFIIDEVAVVESSILSRYLSEARKYNLSLILAGQYFNQISSQLKNAIFANVINYFIFRVSKLDANLLVDKEESEYLGGQVVRQCSFVTNVFQLEIKRRLRTLKLENYCLLKSFIDSMETAIYESYDYSIGRGIRR